ncbi:Flagellin [Lentibacillus sp. JNUCC-1]|nr:flagellin [Lentibacillus sp. JNUCC-1]MUV37065.1 Flagellin [Lentibacillus sp. JNUCC-1]
MISLIQTAEGALNETHAILQRMRELAVQSSNDTNTDTDRAELQKEVDQLASALTDISKDTQFNEKDLLTGDFEATFHVGANQGQNLSVAIDDMGADSLKAGFVEKVAEQESGELEAGNTYSVVSFKATDIMDDGTEAGVGVEDAKYALKDNDGNFVAVSKDGKTYTDLNAPVSDLKDAKVAETSPKEVTFTNAVKNGSVSVANSATSGKLDLEATGGIYIGEQADADKAITTIQSAIDTVSAERSKLGAVQNRLDHTINNLGASAENLTAAESRIRDVDYDLVAA